MHGAAAKILEGEYCQGDGSETVRRSADSPMFITPDGRARKFDRSLTEPGLPGQIGSLAAGSRGQMTAKEGQAGRARGPCQELRVGRRRDQVAA